MTRTRTLTASHYLHGGKNAMRDMCDAVNNNLDLAELLREIQTIVECERKLFRVISVISKYYNCTLEDIYGATQREYVCCARQMAMYIAFEHLHIPVCILSDFFSLTAHAINRAKRITADLLCVDKRAQRKYAIIIDELKDYRIIK